MLTFILFSILVIFITTLYTLWGLIFRVMENPPKLFGFNKLEYYQWDYFKTRLAPKWFFRSAVPLAIINWIIAYNMAGAVSFKEIFATDANFLSKIVTAFTTYVHFFTGLGTSYVGIFLVEFIISVLVMRHKASSLPEIEIMDSSNNFNTTNSTTPTDNSANTPSEQKQITD